MGILYLFSAYYKSNEFDKNADSTGLIVWRIYICFHASICLATIGVCVFCAVTSVAALFDFGGKYGSFSRRVYPSVG